VSAGAVYAGTIRHRRFAGAPREFVHDLALAYLDLDELPALLGGRLVARRPGLVRVRRRDLHGDPHTAPADAVRALVAERTGSAPHGPVRVLTQPRTLGHCFNPISLYYCFDGDGERVDAVVAEVTNTPWGERHAYVLRRRGDERVLRGEDGKRLHVSPFLGMGQDYTWRVSEPGSTLSVHVACREGAETPFDATLSLQRRPLTARSLATLAGGSLRTLALIYGHAARLGVARVPVHRHPARAGA
jgi:uncharacterized protein